MNYYKNVIIALKNTENKFPHLKKYVLKLIKVALEKKNKLNNLSFLYLAISFAFTSFDLTSFNDKDIVGVKMINMTILGLPSK